MDLEQALDRILAAGPYRLVFSSPRGDALQKAAAVLKNGSWQTEEQRGAQAFHQSLAQDAITDYARVLLGTHFAQLHAFTQPHEYGLRITKKGRVLYNRNAANITPDKMGTSPAGHDRQKPALLPEGEAIPPLVDMGVFTPEGRVVKARYAKYRQINRFVELLDDVLRSKDIKKLRIIDFGCGKSYLTFIVYHYLTQVRGIQADITGLDLKADVVRDCNQAAAKYGYEGLRFQVGDIAEYEQDSPVDMVMTLHACDTATDHALAHAVQWNARMIFSVPCCQHELNRQMHSESLALLTRYGIVQERMAALMTDALRANLLCACGYKTQLVEFVDFEHTPKNILIRGVKKGQPQKERQRAMQEVHRLCEEFSLKPTLLNLLKEQGALPAG